MNRNVLLLLFVFCVLLFPKAQAAVLRYQFSQIDAVYATVNPLQSIELMNPNNTDGKGNFYYNLDIGFDFSYNEKTYSKFSVHSNGAIAMGDTFIRSWYGDDHLSDKSSSNNVIAGFSKSSLKPSKSSLYPGKLSYIVTGTVPNRILTIEWLHFATSGGDGEGGDDLNFQIKLYEGTNRIEIVYGTFYKTGTNTSTSYVQVGLRGNNIYDFNSRTTIDNWQANEAAEKSSYGMRFSKTIFPTSGLTFIWDVPPPEPMSFGDVKITHPTFANIGWSSENNQMLKIILDMKGGTTPSFGLDKLLINATGSDNFEKNVENVKLYYTGLEDEFSTANLISSGLDFNLAFIDLNVDLVEGQNYFWITYDVPSGAIIGDKLDVEVVKFGFADGNGTYIPQNSAPNGNRTIDRFTGICGANVTSSSNEDISEFILGPIKTGSKPAAVTNNNGANKTKSYFTSFSYGTLFRDVKYALEISKFTKASTLSDSWLNIFIDYNQDNDFDPILERVYSKEMSSTDTTIKDSILIPMESLIGETRMRVVLLEGGDENTPPCGNFQYYGEIEEYQIGINDSSLLPSCESFYLNSENLIILSKDSQCINEEFTLTLKQYISHTPIIWEVSVNGVSWDSLTTTQTQEISISQEKSSYYRAKIICTDSVFYSSTKYVNTSSADCYCSSSAKVLTCCSDWEGIDSVYFGAMINGAGPSLQNTYYTDYTKSVPIENYLSGQSYFFKVKSNRNGASPAYGQLNVFIDYDQDGIFSELERVYSNWIPNSGPSIQVAVTNLTIPLTAKLGQTKMRIILNVQDGDNTDPPCGEYNKGETEDYLIYIIDPTDFELKSIKSPVNEICYQDPKNVCFEVKNTTTDTFYFGRQELVLNAFVFGVDTQFFSPVIINSGFLAPDSNIELCLKETFLPEEPGNYIFKAFISLLGDINQANDTLILDPINIDINQIITSPSFTYLDSVNCIGAENPIPTLSSLTNGEFSSIPEGLRFKDVNTGEVWLDSSLVGDYTISYTTEGSCPIVRQKVISLVDTIFADFSYASIEYCQSGDNPIPQIGFRSKRGLFSSSFGLNINENSGEIDLKSAIPGVYEVINIVSAQNGCPEQSKSKTISISNKIYADFEYNSYKFCQTDINQLPSFKNEGVAGEFTSDAGLIIDAETGEINCEASIAGNYKVRNTLFGPEGCNEVFDEFSVTIIHEHQCLQENDIYIIKDIINHYTKVLNVNCNYIVVDDPSYFKQSEKALIVQMKGGEIDTTNSPNFGDIIDIGNAGNFERVVISNITNDTLFFDKNLLNRYDTESFVQLVTIPKMSNANVQSTLTCEPWNGTTGGILIFEAIDVNLQANIDVSGQGFRAGSGSLGQGCAVDNTNIYFGNTNGGKKGEGILEFPFLYMRGKLANGGGGGNTHNSGGGGGGSYGSGGLGGKQSSGCSNSIANGGIGGIGLPYLLTTPKMFLGGGGGEGHKEDGLGREQGENGGGIILITAENIIGINNSILANGNDGEIFVNGPGGNSLGDGAGAGGGGGAVFLDVNNLSISLVSVKGGRGSDSYAKAIAPVGPLGPGGGGGGGFINTNSALVFASNVVGGESGVFIGNDDPTAEPNPYGATNGQDGAVKQNFSFPENELKEFAEFKYAQSVFCLNSTNPLPTISGRLGGKFSSYPIGLTLDENTGEVDLTVSEIGTYAVTYAIDVGCEDFVSMTRSFSIPDSLGPNFYYAENPHCNTLDFSDPTFETPGIKGVFSSTLGLDLNSETGRINVKQSPPGLYIVTFQIEDEYGCTFPSETEVGIKEIPGKPDIEGIEELCAGEAAVLVASSNLNPITFQWSSDPNFTNILSNTNTLTTGELDSDTSFYVRVIYESCPGIVNEHEIVVEPKGVIDVTGDFDLCEGESTTLSAVAGNIADGDIFVWLSLDRDTLIKGEELIFTPTESTDVIIYVTEDACINEDTVRVTVNEIPETNAGEDISICDGESTTIGSALLAGNTYSWTSSPAGFTSTDAEVEVSPTLTTTYTLLQTIDATGCEKTDQVTVTVKSLPIANAGNNALVCGNAIVTLGSNPIGGNLYSWTPVAQLNDVSLAQPSFTAIKQSVGRLIDTLYLTVTGANGCINVDSIEVTSLPNPLADAGPDQDIQCEANTNLLASASGGEGAFTYSWKQVGGSTGPSAAAWNGVGAGTYAITVFDENLCFDRDTVNIELAAGSLTATPSANPGTICDGEQATLTVLVSNQQGAPTITWTSPDTAFSGTGPHFMEPNATTTYNVNVSDEAGCEVDVPITVTVNPTPEPVLSSANLVAQGICANEELVFTVSPSDLTNYKFTLDGNGVQNGASNTYTASTNIPVNYNLEVTVVNSFGCQASTTLTYTVNELPTVDLGDDLTVVCEQTKTIVASPSEGEGTYSYSWLDENTTELSTTNTLSDVEEGTYTLNIEDGNGCTASDGIIITNEGNPLVLDLASTPTAICVGESAEISATISGENGALTYTWNETLSGTGPHTVGPSTTTTYTLQVSDDFGCEQSDELEVVVNELPIMSLSSSSADNNFCEGEEITITASPAGLNSYIFFLNGIETSTGVVDNTLNPGALTSANHTIKVIGSTGCEGETTFTITVNPTPSIAVKSAEVEICIGDEALLEIQNPQAGSTYTWSEKGGSQVGTGTSIGVSPTTNTTYTVQVETDLLGCTNSTDLEVIVNPLPIASFTYKVNGLNVEYTAFTGTNIANWTWNFDDRTTDVSNDSEPVHVYAQIGTYNVRLIAENPCGLDTLYCTIKLDGSAFEGNECEVATGVIGQNTQLEVGDIIVYPNPYQNNLNINLEIGKEGEYSLELYDVLGRKIKTLMESTKLMVGDYQITHEGQSVGNQFVLLKKEGRIVKVKKVESIR
ncbi:MAG: hypothetical protein ACJAZ3_000344 [Sphingobacteriales bacterium]|jgi:hypothetical protein